MSGSWGVPLLALACLIGVALGPGAAVATDRADNLARTNGCRHALRQIDRAIGAAGVRDAEAYRVPGFPYLRSNRFLASLGPEILDDAVFWAWMEAMRRLDREARGFEFENLGADGRAGLDQELERRLGPGWTSGAVIDACPEWLQTTDFEDIEASERLVEASAVPDSYQVAARAFGLYPLTAIPVARGWEGWKAANLPAFEVPFGGEPRRGQPTVYRPANPTPPLTPNAAAALIVDAPLDGLGVPDLERDALRELARTHAPVFQIDVASDADRIGHPVWAEDGLPTADPTRPVAFVRLAHARLQGRPVLQLVYTIWFQARPTTGPLDLLGGRLDGLVWRVTFDPDGHPFIYDTIHPCGCYHLFFPAPGVERVDVPEDRVDDLREAPTVPAGAPSLPAGERFALRVAATSHYLTGLATEGTLDPGYPRVAYDLLVPAVPDAPLRAMPLADGGSRSLFGPDAIVFGTGRLERYILWPMGVDSPGAMRQWGHHATAFIGRRHFDDPGLFDEAFAR